MADPRLPSWVPPGVGNAPFVPPRGSLSRPSAAQLERLAQQQIDVQWSMSAFNRSFRLIYGTQPAAGWFMTRPIVNGSGNLVVAIYWAIGPVESIEALRINSRDVPDAVLTTTYTGSQSGVVDPTLAAALPGFADTYDNVAYTVFEIPPATVQGFPQQAQFMSLVKGRSISYTPASPARYWRVYPTAVVSGTDRPGVSELEFRAVPGGPNVATGGTAISGGGGTPANAFDGNTGTEWNATGTIGTAWIGYDAGAGNTIEVNEVWMLAYSTASRTPSSFILEYSNDGSTWFPVMTRTAPRPWVAARSMKFTNNGEAIENPGEHLADFIEDADYGLSMFAIGANDVIAFDDEPVGDPAEPRARAGFTFYDSDARQIIDMIAAHAEALWSYDGLGVLLVPDAAVLSPDAVITEHQMERDTFRIDGKGLRDSPGVISLTYTDRDPAIGPWSQDSVTVDSLSDNDTASVASFPGVYRDTEASRKATQRLRRLAASASFAWQHTDDGIAFQRGDVVRLPNMRGLVDQYVRVLSIDQVQPGVYQITGEPYSDSYYDGAAPAPTVDVPVGGIVPYFGDGDIPGGWAAYTDADGLPLRGDASNAGTNTGSADIPVLSGTTSVVGNHTGPEFYGPGTITPGSGINTRTKRAEGAHGHPYETTGTEPHTMAQVRRRLMEKTGSAGPVPVSGAVFSPGSMFAPDMSAVNTFMGRVFAAGTASEVGDSNTLNIDITIDEDGEHGYHEGTGTGEYNDSVAFGPPVFNDLPGPNHDHGGTASISVTVNAKRRRMAVYVASSDTGIAPGAVIGFDPALPLPTGWAEFDLDGHLLEISTPSGAGVDAGADTVTWTGSTAMGGAHSHKGSQIAAGGRGGYSKYHDTNADHAHSITGSAAFQPLAHCLRFIQYTGV